MIPLKPRTARFVLLSGLALGSALGISVPAQAQGTGAPAGMEPATAPGGTEGRSGMRNEAEAIRDGEAVRVPRGEGIPVETAPEAATPAAPPRP